MDLNSNAMSSSLSSSPHPVADSITSRRNKIHDFLKQINCNQIISKEIVSKEIISTEMSKELTIKHIKNSLNLPEIQMEDIVKSSTIEYLSSGSSGHTFKCTTAICSATSFIFCIKMIPLDKSISLNEPRRPEMIEVQMHSLCNLLFEKRLSPHLNPAFLICLSPIQYFIDYAKNVPSEKDAKGKYTTFIKQFNENHYYDKVLVLCSEYAKYDLLTLIRTPLESSQGQRIDIMTDTHWRCILFQLFSILAQIQLIFPSFRHNDLKSNNILVSPHESNARKYVYRIANREYRVDCLNFYVKLWDFDFVSIQNVLDNGKHDKEKHNITSTKNQYYDIHYFINTFGFKGLIVNFHERLQKAAPKTFDFFQKVVPEEVRGFGETRGANVTESGRVKDNIERFTPLGLIEEDEYFKNFRK